MTRIEKDANFRMMRKLVYKIAESGTWNDLVEWRKKFKEMVEGNALLKGDAKILDNADTFAEKAIFRSNRY